MKKLLVNILLKRGASVFEEVIGKAIRHGLTTVGGGLLSSGLATGSDIEAIIGGALALLAVAISVARIKLQDKLKF